MLLPFKLAHKDFFSVFCLCRSCAALSGFPVYG